MRKKLTEKKEKDIVTSSDSQTVKATDMTNLKELVNELHKNKITPPRDNFKYWSTNLPTVKGDPIRGKVTGKTEEEVYQKLAKFYGIHIIDENATIEDMFYAWQNVKLEDGAITQQGFERCEADFKKFYVRTGWNNRKVKKMTPQEWKYYIENSVRGKTGGNRLTEKQKKFVYADEADVINVALFGMTAKEWRNNNRDIKGNIRDYTDILHLVVLSNLEVLNANMIENNISQNKRLEKLDIK